MKKNVFYIALIAALLALVSISCKSAPPPAEEVSLDSVNELTSRVQEARKRAMDIGSQVYFPSDWEAAETRFAEANNMPKTDNSEVQQALDLLNAVANTYDELFRKSIPLYAQAREDEIMAVRTELLSTEFGSLVPDLVKAADEAALAAKAQYEARDYSKAKDTAARALGEYETLNLGAAVYSKRQEIMNRGFAGYDLDNFDRADEIADTALKTFEAGNKNKARELAEEALLRYNLVLSNAWIAYAAERREAAAEERELAISNKVNVAVREGFREADSFFDNAEVSYRAEKYEEAAILYIEAEALFVIAGKETEEKRIRAEETIRIAEEKIEESSETAIEAERIIEGVSR